MACKDCENSNPITPVYSDAKYVLNGNCADVCNPEIYVPPDSGGGIQSHELIAGTDILIEDFSDATNLVHKISYNPFLALTVDLSIGAYISSVLEDQPVLKGKAVDETRSTWSYNKGIISSQTLDEGSGPVAVPSIDRAKTTTGLTITEDISYQVDGDDGQGESGSTALDIAFVLFGNYQIWGDYTNMLGQAVSQVPTLIANLANKNTEIKRDRLNSVFATGGLNQRFFIIYPAAWGLATFTKGTFEGGLVRLKSEGGVLVDTIVTSEDPISWTNEEGYAEDIYIYQSQYDDREDLVEPIVIT